MRQEGCIKKKRSVVAMLLKALLLYLFMIMPRMLRRPGRHPFAAKYFAHRGLHNKHAGVPENSLKAFEKAASSGYGIELDVHLTKDGIPVVFHDDTLDRMCARRGRISDHTLSELKSMKLLGTEERIPTLEEALRLINGRVSLIVELKMDLFDFRLCRETDRLLQEYKGVYCIESFNPLALFWYRLRRPCVMRGILSDGFIHKAEHRRNMAGLFLLEMLLSNFLSKPDFISYNHEYGNNPSRIICRKIFRCPSAAWTVRSPDELDGLKKKFDVYIFEGFSPDGPLMPDRIVAAP